MSIRRAPINCEFHHILTTRLDITSCSEAAKQIIKWSSETVGRYVCAANVHMCMEANDDVEFRQIVNNAELVLPDGRPLVWVLRSLGIKNATQIRGSDLLLGISEEARNHGVPIGLYGGTPDSLYDFQVFLSKRFPGLDISLAISPPFRPLTEEENAAYIGKINASGAGILFVGIGCPKQEKWMAAQKDKVTCVSVGVGAAFDYFSGRKKESPRWMQRIGMEWLHRLIYDPIRLWKRYLKHNIRFLYYAILQFTKEKRIENKASVVVTKRLKESRLLCEKKKTI